MLQGHVHGVLRLGPLPKIPKPEATTSPRNLGSIEPNWTNTPQPQAFNPHMINTAIKVAFAPKEGHLMASCPIVIR